MILSIGKRANESRIFSRVYVKDIFPRRRRSRSFACRGFSIFVLTIAYETRFVRYKYVSLHNEAVHGTCRTSVIK